MPCPQCRSSRLAIKQLIGLERFIAFFTRRRKYRCRDCHFSFRSPDRRRIEREGPGTIEGWKDGNVIRARR